MYCKVVNGQIIANGSLAFLMPNVTFKSGVTNQELADYGVHPVIQTLSFNKLTEKLLAVPVYENNGVYYNVQVIALSLNERKAVTGRKILENFATKISNGFSYNNKVFQIDDTAQLNMTSVNAMIERGDTDAHGGRWRTLANENISMTTQQAQDFFLAAGAFKTTLIRKAQNAKDTVLAASTIQELEAVDISLD